MRPLLTSKNFYIPSNPLRGCPYGKICLWIGLVKYENFSSVLYYSKITFLYLLKCMKQSSRRGAVVKESD